MNILICHHFGGLGGGSISSINVAETLAAQGHKIFYYAPQLKDKSLYDHIKNKNIVVINENINLFTFHYYNGGNRGIKLIIKTIYKYLGWLKDRKKLAKIIKARNIELVILNSIIQFPMRNFFSKLKVSVCCFIRETMLGNVNTKINSFIQKELNKMDAVAFISNFDKKQWNLNKSVLQEVIKDYPDDYFMQNVAINTKPYSTAQNISETKFRILYLGGLSVIKGVEVAILAMQILGNDYELIILGEDGEKYLTYRGIRKLLYKKQVDFLRKIHRLLSDSKIKNNIKVLGMQKNIVHYLNKCDVLIIPTTTVHQARPIFEAGYLKKTVVVSDFINFHDNVKDGYNGLFFKANDHKDLAQKIMYLKQNEESRIYMELNNYYHSTTQHDALTVNDTLVEFIEIILHNRTHLNTQS